MNKRLKAWLKALVLLICAIALAAAIYLYVMQDAFHIELLDRLWPLGIILSIWLAIEAANQSDVEPYNDTPLFNLIGKYRHIRDKVVFSVALVTVLIFNVLPIYRGNSLWIWLGLNVMIFYGICFIFGTKDLHEGVTPRFLKRFLHREKHVDV